MKKKVSTKTKKNKIKKEKNNNIKNSSLKNSYGVHKNKIINNNLIPLTGADVVAEVMRQINPDVVAAYPISPQSPMMHAFAKSVAEGKVDTELITVESEHSAMSACVGASAAGARVMTATAANGLALMTEIVYIASSLRLPIVMNVGNRALSGPINIHADHSDMMLERDSGWIEFFAEKPQEVYDLNLIALRLAEHKDVLLPVMIGQDGYLTTHTVQEVSLLSDAKVKRWVKEHKPVYPLLNTKKPVTKGPFDLFDYYFEHKRSQIEAFRNAKKVVKEIFKEYYDFTGRRYSFAEEFMTKDAETIMVVMNSTAGTAKEVIKRLRKEGKKVGLLKIIMYRPFFEEEIAKILLKAKSVIVLDRSPDFGYGGPLFTDIRNSLYNYAEINNKNNKLPFVINFIYGLGGREVTKDMLRKAFIKGLNFNTLKKSNKRIFYLGLRE